MTSRRLFRSRSLRLGIALLFVGAIAAPTLAADSDREKARKEREARKKRDKNYYTVDETMHKKLSEALDLLQSEDYDGALELLAPLEKKADRLKPYPRALVYQLLGFLESSRERYPEALAYLEKCLEAEAMPYDAQINTRFNVAQLYLATDRYADAVRSLNLWFEEADSPNSLAYYLLAISYYQLGELEKAVEPAERAVEMVETPLEPWLQLQAGLYFELEEWKKAIDPLEQLVTLYSQKSYWVQLSALYSNDDRGEEALAILQIAYEQDLLDKDVELTQLSKLYLHFGLPYRAALVMEKGLADGTIASNTASWELLANSWLLAREHEKSVKPLARAAKLSKDGNLYVRLAQVYLERDEWSNAAKALEDAIAKGRLSDPGNTNLLLGISFYNQKQPNRAQRHFEVAKASESSGKSAEQWLTILARENQL